MKKNTLAKTGRKRVYAILAALMIVGLVGFSTLSEGKQKPEAQSEERLVSTYRLQTSAGRQFQLTGSVQARVESNLGFRVSGKIVERFVDQGQTVVKGQALMKLDITDLELARKAAHATVIATKAENVRAVLDEERKRSLVSEGAVSKQNYELAKALADSTTAQLRAAEANARQADNQVEYATLKADSDGIIMNVMVDVGQVVAAGQIVASMAQNDTREAVVFLPETKIGYAKNATEAFLYSDQDKRFNVKLRELSATADPVTRTYQAQYTLEGDGKAAPLGATITVSFLTNMESDSTEYNVPMGALYDSGDGSGIWVIDPPSSKVHKKAVKILSLGEEFATISGDLTEGEVIVALGAHLLKENEKVRLAAETAGKQ